VAGRSEPRTQALTRINACGLPITTPMARQRLSSASFTALSGLRPKSFAQQKSLNSGSVILPRERDYPMVATLVSKVVSLRSSLSFSQNADEVRSGAGNRNGDGFLHSPSERGEASRAQPPVFLRSGVCAPGSTRDLVAFPQVISPRILGQGKRRAFRQPISECTGSPVAAAVA